LDIWIIGPERSERIDSFQKHARENGHRVHRIVPGQSVPAPDERLGGVVVFDDGSAELAALLAEVRERTRFFSVPILAAGESEDGLLAELAASTERSPVTPEVHEQVLEPFITAITLTMQEMVGTEVFVKANYQKRLPRTLGDVSAMIGMESECGGTLVLSCLEGAAAVLARRILGEAVAEPEPPLIRDCLGELVNVIAGQSKAILAGTRYHFMLTTPTVVAGAGLEIPRAEDTSCFVIALGSDVGELALQVCIRMG
jgi:chemotaxis protein CheX